MGVCGGEDIWERAVLAVAEEGLWSRGGGEVTMSCCGWPLAGPLGDHAKLTSPLGMRVSNAPA